MASTAIISVVALVGLVVVGVTLTLIFHCVYRRWQRNPASPFDAPRHQLRAQTEQLKPFQVFSEDELELLPIKVLTDKELHNSTQLSSTSHLVDIDSSCECDKPGKRYFTPDCSICLADYKILDVVRILECGHYFHKACIDNWLTKHNINCPVCKANMVVAMNLSPRLSTVVKQQQQQQQQQPPHSYEPLATIRPPPRAVASMREARTNSYT